MLTLFNYKIHNIHLTWFILTIIFASVSSFAQTVDPTRSSFGDNAYLTEYGYSDLELGYSFDNDIHTFPIFLKFGVLKKLEVGLLISGIVNYDGNETEVGDPGFTLKYQLLDESIFALAFVSGMTFSKSSSPDYTIFASPSFQTHFVEIDLTVGTSFIKESINFNNLYFYALTITPKLELPIGIFGEIYYESFSGSNPLYVDFGIGYGVSSGFVIDAGYTIGLNDDAIDWIIQIGFTKSLFKFL